MVGYKPTPHHLLRSFSDDCRVLCTWAAWLTQTFVLSCKLSTLTVSVHHHVITFNYYHWHIAFRALRPRLHSVTIELLPFVSFRFVPFQASVAYWAFWFLCFPIGKRAHTYTHTYSCWAGSSLNKITNDTNSGHCLARPSPSVPLAITMQMISCCCITIHVQVHCFQIFTAPTPTDGDDYEGWCAMTWDGSRSLGSPSWVEWIAHSRMIIAFNEQKVFAFFSCEIGELRLSTIHVD